MPRTYTATENQRWDSVSVAVYGIEYPYNYPAIILANQTYLTSDVPPAGAVLTIPDLDRTVSIPIDKLPPWKR